MQRASTKIAGRIAAILNLAANAFCLYLLTPLKDQDVNMSSVWECSRNDVFEGTAVIATAFVVWLFDSGWPDVIVAIGLVLLMPAYSTYGQAPKYHRLSIEDYRDKMAGGWIGC